MVNRFTEDPGAGVIAAIEEFVGAGENNYMPSTRDSRMYDKPLVRFADGDDPLYIEYKTVIGEKHLLPREVLSLAMGTPMEELPDSLSVISWILPISQEVRRTNRKEKSEPSRPWSHTRFYGERCNDGLREHLVALLREAGYVAVAPALADCFSIQANDKGLYSNWSERHTAFAAGHGTFSLSDGFITERGIAHRCGSVITDLPLPVSEREAQGPYDNCPFFVDQSCDQCISRCPADAITKEGHDKHKCAAYLQTLGYASDKAPYSDDSSVMGCGLCQTKVPCEYCVPPRIEKLRARP